jgi:hypothetical protein
MKRKQLPGTGLDDIIMPTTQKYYDRLHDKIMARIDDTEVEAPPMSAARSFEKPARIVREQVRVWMQSRNT